MYSCPLPLNLDRPTEGNLQYVVNVRNVKLHPEYGGGSSPAKLTQSGRYHKSEDRKYS